MSEAHKPIWRDRCIDLLRSCSNQMHELDFFSPLFLISLDACNNLLTSHFHCTLDFRYALHVCVHAATCTTLVNSHHPLLRFLRPFMQFCDNAIWVVFKRSFSFCYFEFSFILVDIIADNKWLAQFSMYCLRTTNSLVSTRVNIRIHSAFALKIWL